MEYNTEGGNRKINKQEREKNGTWYNICIYQLFNNSG